MLQNDIRINAMAIWTLLSERGKLSLKEIKEITKYKDSFIHLALGWLSKENKVELLDREDGSVYVELKTTFSDLYY